MSELEERIIFNKIMSYGFMDDNKNYTVVLNEEKLKEIFNADVILLKEEGHR